MTEPFASQGLRESATFDRATIHAIQRAAETGIYDIRGGGAKRRLPHFDDLLFLGASMSRYPLEGYRERCDTDVVLGDRFASTPLHLDIPVTIAGMSFGALSAQAKEALGRGASEVGTSTTTGDGGMTDEERGQSKNLVYQYLPSRYGMNPDHLRKADAIEVVLGQGAKPGGGGMLLGQKISERVAGMRTLPMGVDQRSACRHPDWTGPDDLTIKIAELREITDWQKPIYVKVGATRTYYDVKLAVKAGADVVVVDGMQGGTAATQEVFIEHVGIPTLPAIGEAVRALQEMNMHRKVQLIVSGGIRNGADVAKCMALGADAVSIGTAALIALGDNHPSLDGRVPKARLGRRFLRRLAGRPRPGRHHHPGRRAGVATRPGQGRASTGQLPAGADHGGADHRPGLRQGAPAPSGAGGHGGPHHRGRGHDPHPAGRHVLDPRGGTVTLPDEVDVLVVGAGLMGSMTAWAAARRGLSVAVLEQYGIGHEQGSSHGSARIVRRAYPDRLYVDLTGQAFDLWTELEHQSGQSLLRMTGGLDHGGNRDVDRIADEFVAAGVPHQLMPAAEAEKRWPGMKFETDVLFHEQAGTVDPDRAVRAALDLAVTSGASVTTDTAVTSVTVDGDSAVVKSAAGEVRARRIVLAPGAWLSELGAGISGLDLQLPPLRVSQQQIFHFARRDGIPEWPTSVHKGEISTYSLAGGRDGGPGGARKVAEHDAPGMDTSTRSQSGVVDPVCQGTHRALRPALDAGTWFPTRSTRPPACTPPPRTTTSCSTGSDRW